MSEIITQMFAYFKNILQFCVTKLFLRYENNKNVWSSNENLKKYQIMEFKEYVNSLPNQRDLVISQLAIRCRVTSITVYRWLRGDFVPSALKRKVIADYLQKPEKELWPNV